MSCFFGFSDCRRLGVVFVLVFVLVRYCFDYGPRSAPVLREREKAKKCFFLVYVGQKNNVPTGGGSGCAGGYFQFLERERGVRSKDSRAIEETATAKINGERKRERERERRVGEDRV